MQRRKRLQHLARFCRSLGSLRLRTLLASLCRTIHHCMWERESLQRFNSWVRLVVWFLAQVAKAYSEKKQSVCHAKEPRVHVQKMIYAIKLNINMH